MAMVFFMRGKYAARVCFLLLLGMLMASGCVWRAEQAKADKSNAVQVVKRAEETELSAKTDFFAEYRLQRDKLRSERSELLRESMRNADSEENRKAARENILQLMLEKQRETEMESLIKAKGFADALVFSENASISAIVKADALTKEEVVQVADIIRRIGDAKQEEITISAKP